MTDAALVWWVELISTQGPMSHAHQFPRAPDEETACKMALQATEEDFGCRDWHVYHATTPPF